MPTFIDKNDINNKNPWWNIKDFKIGEKDLFHRDIYYRLEKDLDISLILNIVGLRRVGKSTIMKQLVGKLLSDGINPSSVFYYLFDDLSQINTPQNLEAVLNYFLENIVQKKIYDLQDRVYIFLDEIQYIEDWQVILKKFYDLSGKQIKFVISGSQSILLSYKSTESLAGRIFDYYLDPLSFREFLKIKNENLTDEFPRMENDIFTIKNFYSDLSSFDFLHSKKLSEMCNQYILSGQFPECLNLDPQNANVYIKESVVGKVIEDITKIYDIDNKEKFKILAQHLLANSGSLLELKNIASQIELSVISLGKYLDYLQSGYLFKILYKQHKTLIKQGRILKKIYTTSPNFICAAHNYELRHFIETPEMFGKIIETVIYNWLDKNYGKNYLIDGLSFWRQGEKEIDFIVAKDKKQLPIEVKFTNNINQKELSPLIDYLKKKKLDYGIVITKSIFDKKIINDQTVYFIPYYLILLMI